MRKYIYLYGLIFLKTMLSLQTIKENCLQVPGVHWDLSSKRILTMSFAEGGQVNDKDYMKKHGISVNEVPLDIQQ